MLPQKVIDKTKLEGLEGLRSLMKVAGSLVGSGSVPKCHGSGTLLVSVGTLRTFGL
jgi:hypothetical protein